MTRTFADDFHAGDWGYLAGFMARSGEVADLILGNVYKITQR
jgi:hypothetical protein